MTTISTSAYAVDSDDDEHTGLPYAPLESGHVLGDSDTESVRSVEISLDSSPASPSKTQTSPLSLSSEHATPSSALRSSFSAVQEHPLSPKEIENKTAPVEPPTSPVIANVPQTAPPAPSISSARTSMAPSFASTFASEHESVTSVTSSVSVAKKVRPESVVIDPGSAKLILGLAVVDFNHIVSIPFEMMSHLTIMIVQIPFQSS